MSKLKTQFGEALTADFEENTWTFEMKGEFKVSAGYFAILPEEKYQRLLTDLRGSSSGVIRTERGWAGHFIGANKCRFRRNTLLTYNDIKIVVSTVGLMELDGKFVQIGAGRYFETMAFHSDPTDTRYYDADVSKQVNFDSDWGISEVDADDKANEMHEAVVTEISTKLEQGCEFDKK